MPTDLRGSSRVIPRWLWPLAVLLLLARIGVTWREQTAPPSREDLVHWVPWVDAADESRRSGKPVMIEFSAAWCGPCQRMAREVFGDANRAHGIDNSVVPVRIIDRQQEDGHNSALVDSLQKAVGVDAFPTLAVIDLQSGTMQKTSGYSDANSMQQWLGRSAMVVRMNHLHNGH